jgi:hypothetical protein
MKLRSSCPAVALLFVVACSDVAGAQVRADAAGNVRLLPELQSLITAGIPVGLVLANGEPLDIPVPLRGDESQKTEEAPVRGLMVGAFTKRWDRVFTVADSGRAVSVISPRANRCRAGLQRKVPAGTYNGRPYEILFSIAKAFDSSLESLPPPGILSSRVSSGSAEALASGDQPKTSARLLTEISLITEQGTLRAALDELAVASALGWFAREVCDEQSGKCACQLGLLTPTSVSLTSYDATAGLELGR